MKLLIWHWGRRGAGPLFASRLHEAVATLPGHTASLSLAAGAEILTGPASPACEWQEETYENAAGYVVQRVWSVAFRHRTLARLQAIGPDFAVCAMPALLDQRMTKALHAAKITYAVIVHDAAAHPGEKLSFRMLDQARLLDGAAALFALTSHVEADLRRQGFGENGQILQKLWHPPFDFGRMPPPLQHGGPPRLLFFGRLLPYKGLDLLGDALESFGPDLPFRVRVCGEGPDSRDLARLRRMPNVEVDRRWIPEAEVPGLIAWADGILLPYRQASQSGVAAAAIAQGRYVLATKAGGLPEQLAGFARAKFCAADGAAIARALTTLFEADGPGEPAVAARGWPALAGSMLDVLAPSSHVAPELVAP